MISEKEVFFQSRNTYSTLNTITPDTKNIWVVFHGIGYLSRYFLKYFRKLNREENYIIAPQAPSRYYLDKSYKSVGASWATREGTERDIENVLVYLDEVYAAENLEAAPNLILFGYSQGVSVVSRWVSRRRIKCAQLILHSGKIPHEIQPHNLSFLDRTRITYIYGTQDPYFSTDNLEPEQQRIKQLFPENLLFLPFDGGHEINEKIILELGNQSP